jgi:hypothetical protein
MRPYRGISTLDRPQVMRLASMYELPFGPGKRVGGSTSGVWARLLEGWSLSGYLNLGSGEPLGISHANGRPLRARNPAKSGSISDRLGDRVDPATGRVLNPYFDIDAFAPLPSIYVVSPEVPFLDELRGPGAKSLNLALFKNVTVWERMKLQVRMEATGVTNTPIFANPDTNMSQAATFGVIRSAGGSRNIQVGARLVF